MRMTVGSIGRAAFIGFIVFQTAAAHAAEDRQKTSAGGPPARDPYQEIMKNNRAVNGPGSEAFNTYQRITRLNNEAVVHETTIAIQKDPKNAAAYARRGAAYASLSNFEKAQLDYDKALELNPNLGETYAKRAVSHYMNGDYDKSWADVRAAQRLKAEIFPEFLTALKAASKRDK